MARDDGPRVFHGLPNMDHWHRPASHLQGPPPGVAFGRSPYVAPPMNPHHLSFREVQPAGPGPYHGLPLCPPQHHPTHAHPTHAHPAHAHPTHAHPTHAHPSGHRADEGYVAEGLRRGIPIEQLIPADPDEEHQPQAGRLGMQLQQGVPVRSAGAGQFDLATRLAAMETHSEEEQKYRLRLEAKLDGLTDILKELKDSRTQPVPPAVPAASAIQNNEPAATPDELNARLQQIEQRLSAGHDENPATRQHLAHQAPTMGANLACQRQAGQDEDDLMEEGDAVAGGRTTNPAQKRRSVSGSAAAGAQRAKRARHNTSDEAEGAPHSDPLPFPEALGTPGEPQQAVEGPQPANPVGQPSGAAGPVPSGDDDDDDGLRWARDFLACLKRMDCTSDADLLRLKKYVKGKASFDFPLCTDSPTRRSKFCYFLKVGGSLSTTLTLNPHNRPAGQQAYAAHNEVENLNIFETYLDSRCPEATTGTYRKYRPPKYLAPLGEVYRASRSTDSPEEVSSTNFFVFVDVGGGPHKSVWLLYRYEKPVANRDRVQWEPVSISGQREAVFNNRLPKFDTVCLLDDVAGWGGPEEDMVGVSRFTEALPATGSMILRPVFYTPVLEKFREAIKIGWEGAGSEE
ncbi:hypothetical protein C8A01DRAFT_49208 [Parachaetomium inaequale]|uniref:Uncharacterized protein n=1 Tax=Parachaetomium inaequale TaxID=2588326 RepID=A0AAN6P9V1_9PEZI|nr:hypothetical protein C8A01DRAFT_49208 [Parachaetomium inaequale]